MDKRIKIEFTDNLNLNTLDPEEDALNKIIKDYENKQAEEIEEIIEEYENKQVEEIEEIINGMFDDVITSSIKTN